jgi:hypothetical protein
MEYLALTFGLIGFVLAVAAYNKVDNLEKELKRKDILDENFDGDP